MTSKLTAAEAQNIARSKDPSRAVIAILEKVRIAAQNGQYELVIRDYGFGDGSCYTSPDNYPPLCTAIIKELRELGYTAEIGSSCGQFVDVWLSVVWGKKT
jgi:hypothetical protein